MFPNEIIDALTQKEPPKVVHIYGVHFGNWSKPITPNNWIWTGQSVTGLWTNGEQLAYILR